MNSKFENAIDLDANNKPMDHVVYFDPQTGEWSMCSCYPHERHSAPEAVWNGRELSARVQWGTSAASLERLVADCPVDVVAAGHIVGSDNKGRLSDEAADAWEAFADELHHHVPEFSMMDADEFFVDSKDLRQVFDAEGRSALVAEMQELATYEGVVCVGIEEHADELISEWS
jgi:hypothetical protein